MAKPVPRDHRGLLPLVEEATHLLRRVPMSLWLVHLAGSLPFVLCLFYFWSDMSRSGLAEGRLLESSLVLALLYLVMKIAQAWFSDGLMALTQGRELCAGLPLRGWLRLISSQMWLHATAPWVLFISMVTLLPLSWTYPFYHHATILAVDHFRRGGRTRGLIRQSMHLTTWQFGQQSGLLGLLTVGGIMVYVNLVAGFALVMMLSKSISGTDNAFTMSPMLVLSTPVQALLISLCYLIMNPLVKAIYVLRCFYGAARRTGADIEVRLRALRSPGPLVVFLLLFGVGAPLHAEAVPSPSLMEQKASVSSDQLDESIQDVLRGSEFQWRMPREGGRKQDDSLLGSAMRDFTGWLNASLDDLGKMLGDAMDWLFGRKKKSGDSEGFDPDSGASTGSAWADFMPTLLKILAAVLVLALAWVFFRHWRQGRQTAVVEAPAVPEINLEQEGVVASQLPENEWLRLAREKMEAGELRLALRALFLATLAHLGEKRLLQISRTKSNGDYVQELGWRTRGRADLHESFHQQVRTFDRVWYGWHEVSRELMTGFQDQHERITSHAT